MRFLLKVWEIILIDLTLAGDNALVIAMALRSLPRPQRRLGSALGAGAAVAMRVALTFVAARLLTIEYVQLAGGLLVLWIAVKVLRDASDPPHAAPSPARLAQAIWYIALADLTMSTDNILAIAGASKGNFGVMLFGLAVSIPFVVASSNVLASFMDRYRWTIYLGAAVLGQVGGEMVLTDHFVTRTLDPADLLRYGIEAGLALALFVAGFLMGRKRGVRS